MPIRWVDAPPPANPGRPKNSNEPKYGKEAREFRRHPGQWGILTTDAGYAFAYQLTHGHVAAFRDGQWEAVCRANPTSKPGRGTIYVRYLGEGDNDE